MHILRSMACGVAIGASAAVCLAGSTSSFFQVNITLHTGLPPVVPSDPGAGAPPPGGGGALPVPPVVPGPFPNQPDSPLPVPPVAGGPGTTPPDEGVSPPPTGGVMPGVTPPSIVATVPPNGICTSHSGGSVGGATVSVVCSSGQFVSIEALPGQPFAQTHGGAYRFSFGPGLPLPALAANFSMNIGAGTVTALRILHVNGLEAPLEMLVSF